jgi:hypothetical protein
MMPNIPVAKKRKTEKVSPEDNVNEELHSLPHRRFALEGLLERGRSLVLAKQKMLISMLGVSSARSSLSSEEASKGVIKSPESDISRTGLPTATSQYEAQTEASIKSDMISLYATESSVSAAESAIQQGQGNVMFDTPYISNQGLNLAHSAESSTAGVAPIELRDNDIARIRFLEAEIAATDVLISKLDENINLRLFTTSK